MSIPMTFELMFFLKEIAIQPEPVPISIIFIDFRFFSLFIIRDTSSSVSGLGIKTLSFI